MSAGRTVAFVSSVIEGGVEPQEMADIRTRLTKLGLATYDCLSPELMDAVAAYSAKTAPASPRATA